MHKSMWIAAAVPAAGAVVLGVLFVIGSPDEAVAAKPQLPGRKVHSDSSPQAKSVVDAFVQGTNPERLTPMLAPKPFDAGAYKKNPKAYLDVVEPGRVFQVAQPTGDTPSIELQGDGFRHVDSGQSIPLSVKVPPGAPVTYTSFDLGAFDNGLTSITVQADESGIASARFTATSDTTGRCQLAIGCPLTTEIVDLVVQIHKR